jgi:aspartyl-tRNA(Asn)/glutamyl-tRNA(Gln) amidotransferase subunit B
VQIEQVAQVLSEETEPSDWAALIEQIKLKIESGIANGIVITHGTDTLPYTASLVFWLFGGSEVPIVLTASAAIPGEDNEARQNLNFAVRTAKEKKRGVFVAYKNNLYSPLNLKFINHNTQMFGNWNLKFPMYTYEGGISANFLSVQSPEKEIMADILNDAASQMAVIRMYPGLPSYRLTKMFEGENPVTQVILELYAAGTGNMRNSDYSLKPLLLSGRKHNIHFYSTSQQECAVDFSEYASSADVWREGVVPMEMLTTESVVSLYFAASLIADTSEELCEIIESATDNLPSSN